MWALPATFVCVLLLVAQPRWTLGAIDVALALIVLLASFARFADVHWCGGETAEGDPATPTDALRYAAMLFGAGVAGWLLGQSVTL